MILKDHVTGIMASEYSALLSEINYIIKYIQNIYFLIILIFHNITVFTVFLIKYMQKKIKQKYYQLQSFEH